MTTFNHVYRDEDVTVEVIDYMAASPVIITGSGYGDADAGEQEHIEFNILDKSDVVLATERDVTRDEFFEILAIYKELAE